METELTAAQTAKQPERQRRCGWWLGGGVRTAGTRGAIIFVVVVHSTRRSAWPAAGFCGRRAAGGAATSANTGSGTGAALRSAAAGTPQHQARHQRASHLMQLSGEGEHQRGLPATTCTGSVASRLEHWVRRSESAECGWQTLVRTRIRKGGGARGRGSGTRAGSSCRLAAHRQTRRWSPFRYQAQRQTSRLPGSHRPPPCGLLASPMPARPSDPRRAVLSTGSASAAMTHTAAGMSEPALRRCESRRLPVRQEPAEGN